MHSIQYIYITAQSALFTVREVTMVRLSDKTINGNNSRNVIFINTNVYRYRACALCKHGEGVSQITD